MEISEIKQRLSILTILKHYHLECDHHHRLRCPFHDDKTPSMQVYPKTGTWTCFSSNCEAGSGDQVDFIMRMEGITKHEAIMKAKDLAGHNRNDPAAVQSAAPSIKRSSLSQKQRSAILTESFTHFVRSMSFRPTQAVDYFSQRHLDYKRLSVGYDAGTLHKRKDTTEKKKQGYLHTGVIKPDRFGRKGSYYTRFNGCVVFPLLDSSGQVVSLYGRHTSKPEHHYLEGDHRGLYPGYPEPSTKRLILTEAIIDAATLVQIPEIADQYGILALYGTNGFTGEHREAIAALKQLKEVVLFFDGDQAGKESVGSVAAELWQINEDLTVTMVDTPGGEDVNSLLQSHDKEIFTHLLESRIPCPKESEPSSFSTELVDVAGDTSINNKKTTGSSSGPDTAHPDPAPRLQVSSDYMSYESGTLQITLWGGIEIHTVNRLRATLHIQLQGNEYTSFRDTADLYSHSQSDRLVKQASEKLEVSSSEVSEAIAGLTRELERYRQQKREEKRLGEQIRQEQGKDRFSTRFMQKATSFMNSGDLTRRTHGLFGNLGLIGQQDDAALLFFIFLTRFFKNPLHAIVMGSSGSGKTHLLQGVAGCVPRQHIHMTTSLSENTLYYTPKDFLKHKILLQEDLDGAYNALLPLRELMSNQEISRFSTRTNSRTGDSKQVYLHVEGPVCVAGATTRDKIYEDNANRSFLIQIEENPRHEAEVLEYQGRVAAGMVNMQRYEENIRLLKACQLLIRPVEVIIPFAPELELPPHVFKKMRTKNHYLTLIKAVTLWNQHQRKRRTDTDGSTYISATLEDVEWANYLCKDSLLRKSDELGGKTRNFFESLKKFLQESQQGNPMFYAKDIRKYFRLHPMQLKRFMDELEGRGFIKCRSRSNKTGNEYEVTVWDDYQLLKNGISMLDGLVEKLKTKKPKVL
jgi:DNA primase catalytic core